MGWAKYDEDIREAIDERENYPEFFYNMPNFVVSSSVATTQAIAKSGKKTPKNHIVTAPPQINFTRKDHKKSKSATIRQMLYLDYLANKHNQNRKSGGKIHYENRIQYKHKSVL